MLKLCEPIDSRAYLLYSEHGSKNNPGGLRERKITKKIFSTPDDPKRCVVEKYMALRPSGAVFYLQPLKKPVGADKWYQARAVGHNSLNMTVKRLCEMAGADG